MEPPLRDDALAFGNGDRLQQEAVAVFQFKHTLLIGSKRSTRALTERCPGLDGLRFACLGIHGAPHRSLDSGSRERDPSALQLWVQRLRMVRAAVWCQAPRLMSVNGNQTKGRSSGFPLPIDTHASTHTHLHRVLSCRLTRCSAAPPDHRRSSSSRHRPASSARRIAPACPAAR